MVRGEVGEGRKRLHMGPAKFILFPEFCGEKQIKEEKDGEKGIKKNDNL
jgi:hypothetical protein